MEEIKFKWANKDTRKFMERGYLLPGVTVEQRVKDICDNAEKINGIVGFSDKLYYYMSQGWISLSTPIWTNYGLDRGLPISCFGGEYQDDTSDILRGLSETGMLTKVGGGTAGYFGNIRPRGSIIKNNGQSNGSVSFMEMWETTLNVISQGNTRRGSFAAYLPIDHKDIKEFLKIRSDGHPIQNLSIGITIPEGWIESMTNGDNEKRKIWTKVLEKRSDTGYPYILFEDNVNNNLPQVYKDKKLKVKMSQLCTEILEYTDDKKTFTCCLSSVNILYYDLWKHTDLVQTVTIFLDTVLTEFINKAKHIPFLEKAVRFAEEHRSIGLGVLGWHSYLQSKMIPFEGMESKMLNAQIFKHIWDESLIASKWLANEFGEPEMLKGYGERFTTRIAPAPTTSSAFILEQVSQSIEPNNSNYYIKDLAKGKFTYRNPFLKKLLHEKGYDNEEIWKSILMKGGSVQHLDYLTEREKFVFKTFGEISQLEIIQQAAQRQRWIDQSQSLNLMIHPDVKLKELNSLMLEAHKLGIKTLYYQRSANLAQEVGRNLMDCVSCEG